MSLKSLITSYWFFQKRLRNIRDLLSISSSFSMMAERKGLVIVPCDWENVLGSRGDEAMITATIQQFRKVNQIDPIYMLGYDDVARTYIENANLDPDINYIPVGQSADLIENVVCSITRLSPEHVVILGADCMDGAYSPFASLDLIGIYNILSQTNIRVTLLGFSFNDHPFPKLKKAFLLIKDQVYSLRDPISKTRFEKFCESKTLLVADAAFSMTPDFLFPEYSFIKDRIEQLRVENRTVVGINLHPMLKNYPTIDSMKEDASKIGDNLICLMERLDNLGLVFIPHDDRSRINDRVMLDLVVERIRATHHSDRIFFIESVPRASQLKAITSLLDGLISSRMHLAIAALGSNIPVLGIAYQGKFEGLFELFEIPKEFLITLDTLTSSDFLDIFRNFYVQLGALTEIVIRNHPKVMQLSALNFTNFKHP